MRILLAVHPIALMYLEIHLRLEPLELERVGSFGGG